MRKRIQNRMESIRRLYEIWLSQQMRNYTASGQRRKTVSIQVGNSSVSYALNRKDFVGAVKSIRVVSPLLERVDGNIKNQVLAPMVQGLVASGDPISAKRVQREVLRNSGMYSESEIEAIIPPLPEEIIIERENTLLANNIEVAFSESIDPRIRAQYQLNIPTDAGRRFAIQIQTALAVLTAQATQREQLQQPEVLSPRNVLGNTERSDVR